MWLATLSISQGLTHIRADLYSDTMERKKKKRIGSNQKIRDEIDVVSLSEIGNIGKRILEELCLINSRSFSGSVGS